MDSRLSSATQAEQARRTFLQRASCNSGAGANYRFCAHNDVGVDRFVPWHKDKLNGQYQRFQRLPLWSEEHDGHDGYENHTRDI